MIEILLGLIACLLLGILVTMVAAVRQLREIRWESAISANFLHPLVNDIHDRATAEPILGGESPKQWRERHGL
jgi:hypothetical protein